MSNQKIILSKFKDLYPTYQDFKTKVQDPILAMHVGNVPAYLDEAKLHYTWQMLFTFLGNKYDDFHAVNEDERTHKLMFNAFMHLMPTLYAKTKMLTPEALALLTPEKLLSIIERRYNEDADTKFATTETTYSSSPDDSQLSGTFDVENVKEKNLINRKDLTVRIRETSNLLGKLKEMGEVRLSGFIYDFVNSIEFSSLFDLMPEGAVVYKVEGPAGKDGKDADGLPWLEDKYADLQEFRNNAKLYEVVKYSVNSNGTNNVRGFTFLVKTQGGIISLRSYEETVQYVNDIISSLGDDIQRLIEEVQMIENTWTGNENAHGVDLASLQGDKGVFDLTTNAKLIATFKLDGLTPEVTSEVEVIQGKHVVHLTSVDRTVDVSFQVQTAPIADNKHLLAISDFQSHGTTTKTENDIKLVGLMQNPKVVAVIDAFTKVESDARYELKGQGSTIDLTSLAKKDLSNITLDDLLAKLNITLLQLSTLQTTKNFTDVEKTALAHFIQFRDKLDLAINHSAKFANLPANTNTEIANLKAKDTELETKINALSGGIKMYHFGDLAAANTAKTTTTFQEGDIAWIGTSGAWLGYHFTGGNWEANGTTSSHTATLDAYTKAEAKSLFAPKEFDYSGSTQAMTFNESAGKRYQLITKPVGENAPIGTDIILVPKVTATDPTQVPQDADQITYGADLLWIDKSKTDIMSWSEVKDNVNNGDKMVITKIEDGHYQLVKWIKAPEQGLEFDNISGTIFNGHALEWEYVIPNGFKIYSEFTFSATDPSDINGTRTFAIDTTKKSQWEDFGKVLEQGYGEGVEYHLEGYHDVDGGITKFKMTNPQNISTAYFGFVISKVTVEGITTNKIIAKDILNKEVSINTQIIDLTQYSKAKDLFAVFEKLPYGSLVRLNRGSQVFVLAMLGKKTHGKYHPDDTTEVDYYELSTAATVFFLNVQTFKIPNQDIAWTTGVGGNTPVNIGVGQNANVLIGEKAKDINIGSTVWVDGDGKGVIHHGSKSTTFEKIIERANQVQKTITLTFDDGTTEDIKVG